MNVVTAAGLDVVRAGRLLLSQVTFRVDAGQQWALLGPNGAGKSTLLRSLGAWQFPTRGKVEVLGHELGKVDLRQVRRGIGWVDPSFAVRADATVRTVVLTGATATSDLLLRREIPAAEQARADSLLELLGVARVAEQRFHTLSAGERGRTLIARSLLAGPRLLLLDEPFTGLDLAGRELLRARLSDLADAEPALASILVTHHLEELPRTTTHAALLRDGRLIAAGPVADILTSQALTECFGLTLTIERRAGGWSSYAPLPSDT